LSTRDKNVLCAVVRVLYGLRQKTCELDHCGKAGTLPIKHYDARVPEEEIRGLARINICPICKGVIP
jgi:hypothetical protein